MAGSGGGACVQWGRAQSRERHRNEQRERGPHGAPRGTLRTFGGPSIGHCGDFRASLGAQYHPSVVPSGLYGAGEGPMGLIQKSIFCYF